MIQSRRRFLQALFLGGGAVTCAALWVKSGFPGSGALRGSLLCEKPQELALPNGSLLDIGPLQSSSIDGIKIPKGFGLRRVAVSGKSISEISSSSVGLSPTHIWHDFPDGGAVFPVDDGWIYVSNSEKADNGGASAIRFGRSGRIAEMYPILKGTRRNCAGGPTPWGTWLSCEEVPDGQVFECDPLGDDSSALARPALGIFNHEAAAVDWASRTIFLTEDAPDGRLYRFRSHGTTRGINNRLGLDLERGSLEVLEIEGYESGGYQSNLSEARVLRKVNWIPVVSPDKAQHEVRASFFYECGYGAPGTVFKGGEGIWIHQLDNSSEHILGSRYKPTRAVIFFACKGDNRVYALDVANDLIEVVFDNDQLAFPDLPFSDVDNLTVSPAGDVIVAEDGEAMRLMVMNPNGPSKILLQVPGGGSELTGPAFSPDGSRLYFSSQRGAVFGQGIGGRGVTYELTLPSRFVVSS